MNPCGNRTDLIRTIEEGSSVESGLKCELHDLEPGLSTSFVK
jgi:hypothetical protein